MSQRYRNVSSTQTAQSKITANREAINNDNDNNLEAGDTYI